LIGQERLRAAIPSGYPTAGLAILDQDDESWVLREFIVA
jgi:phosphohistidine phosphatase